MNTYLASLFFLLTLIGCNTASSTNLESEPQSGLPTTSMTIGTRTFVLEIATTPKEHEVGLMNRDSMPADHGMIFVFPSDIAAPFWMKHTRIPLDILYVASTGRIVSIHQMRPFDVTGVVPAGPYRYAIELNQGAAAAAGVKANDILNLPDAVLIH